MADSLNIVVLAGGISHERDVSLRSGRRAADALSAAGHSVTLRDPDASLLPFLTETRPDVVFLALHGSSGEDGALIDLLEAAGIPFVGSPSEAARLAWSKPVAASLVRRAGLAVPQQIVLSHEAFRELGAASVLRVVADSFDGDVVIKPGSGGSAQGVSIVSDYGSLPRAMVDAFTYSDVAIIEQRIVGTEIAVAIIEVDGEPITLPAVEIEPVSGVYSFEARYNAGETTFYAPSRLSDEDAARASDAALAVHSLLGLRDLSRVDFIVDDEGVPWFLEVNVLPGLTETSSLPLALDADSRSAADVYSALAGAAAGRKTR